MDKKRVQGKLDELVGIAKRKTGKLTGSTHLQVEGVAQQVKGKLESALGQAKDAVRDAKKGAVAGSKRRG
jgi:uncharacterized protein YjbJ (UPF0337 family)